MTLVTNQIAIDTNFSGDIIKAENQNLLANKENSSNENKSRKNSEHKKFVLNANTKSKLAFEIDFHGIDFDKIFKRNRYKNN
jgi:hypothetical protein